MCSTIKHKIVNNNNFYFDLSSLTNRDGSARVGSGKQDGVVLSYTSKIDMMISQVYHRFVSLTLSWVFSLATCFHELFSVSCNVSSEFIQGHVQLVYWPREHNVAYDAWKSPCPLYPTQVYLVRLVSERMRSTRLTNRFCLT